MKVAYNWGSQTMAHGTHAAYRYITCGSRNTLKSTDNKENLIKNEKWCEFIIYNPSIHIYLCKYDFKNFP